MLPADRFRVGYVVKRYPRYSETFIVNEILAHEAAGMDIEIFSLLPPVDTHFQEALAKVRAPVNYLPSDGVKAADFWAAIEGAGEVLPDLAAGLAAARGEESRDVYQGLLLAREVHLKGIGHLHAHFASAAATVARLAAGFARVPYTFTAHAKDIFHQNTQSADLRRKLRDAAAVVTVSDYNVAHLLRTFGPAAIRLQRIYNGIDLAQFPFQVPRVRPPQIVAVGRLVEKKGFADLVAACGILDRRGRRFSCQIVGTGPLEDDLCRQIERLGLQERVALAGNDHLREALERRAPFDLLYERYSLWSYAGMEYARDSAIPGMLEVNAPLIEEQEEYRGLADRAGAERVAERAFGAATALLAVSDEIATYLRRYPGASGRVHVVPNGVNPNRFPADLRPSHPGEPGTFTVGFVGTLKPWHGLPVLAEAFAALHREDRRARLLVVGDGTQRQNLVQNLRERGLAEAAFLTGAVDPACVPGLLASMDVAVAPYPMGEHCYFSPLKVYEYMAAGLPIVASRVGQLAGLLRDGANALLCPPGDAAALTRALFRLRSDPGLRARLGHSARTTVLKGHTWDAVAGRIVALAGFEATRHACPQPKRAESACSV